MMKRLKLIVLAVALIISSTASAQILQGEWRVWSSNLTQSTMGIDNLDQMYGLSYRLSLAKINIGVDLGMSKRDKNMNGYETDCTRYMVMPAVEMNFVNLLGLVRFYISGGAGYMWGKNNYEDKTMTDSDKKEFIYQISPLCARVKLGPIGIFAECGYGHKGLVSGGVILNF
jgi:hypothetical protein